MELQTQIEKCVTVWYKFKKRTLFPLHENEFVVVAVAAAETFTVDALVTGGTKSRYRC